MDEVTSDKIKTRIPANQVKKGDVVLIKGRPCKIVEVHVSKNGKHGSAKTLLQGMDNTDQSEVQTIVPSTEPMDVLNP